MAALASRQRSDKEASSGLATAARAKPALGDMIPAAALLTAGLAGLSMASLSVSEKRGQYLVILSPWSSFGQALDLVGAAEGAIIEPGRFGNILIATSSRADFAKTAREAGAWIVLPSPRLAGCVGTRAGESGQ